MTLADAIIVSEPFLSPLGLGCSRIGSVHAGLSERQVNRLIEVALDSGVTAFDTADIYGQGDSERLIGRALRNNPSTFISTKAGQRFHWRHRALLPVKAALAPAIERIPLLRQRIQEARSRPLARCFEPDYLTHSLEGSLRRLGRNFVDAFYLHNPETDVLTRGAAVERLVRLRERGLLRHVGVSVYDSESLRAALADNRVTILQAPVSLITAASVHEAIALRRVLLIGREVLGGPNGRPAPPEHAKRAIAAAVSTPGIANVLVGTTKPDHIAAAASAAQSALAA